MHSKTHKFSTKTTGVLELLKAMDEALRSIMVHVEVVLPYSEASTLSQVHRYVIDVHVYVYVYVFV